MGSPISPSLTDLRMFEIVSIILDSYEYRNKIVSLSVYRDDGFILFNGTNQELESLYRIANSIHPLLKFKYNISDSTMQFLDVTIFKGNRFQTSNILDTKIYHKPTENFQYLHRTSAHPASVFKGFIAGGIN